MLPGISVALAGCKLAAIALAGCKLAALAPAGCKFAALALAGRERVALALTPCREGRSNTGRSTGKNEMRHEPTESAELAASSSSASRVL